MRYVWKPAIPRTDHTERKHIAQTIAEAGLFLKALTTPLISPSRDTKYKINIIRIELKIITIQGNKISLT